MLHIQKFLWLIQVSYLQIYQYCEYTSGNEFELAAVDLNKPMQAFGIRFP